MSILIKGLEMPKSCGNCFFDTRCDNWRLRNWGAPPSDDCPLRPVPPHGRLIDADALAAQCDDPYWCVWLSDIEAAPTIIQAEEGET